MKPNGKLTQILARGKIKSLNGKYVRDCIGESRQPWANRLFSKSMQGKILNFLHEVEKMISVMSVQV